MGGAANADADTVLSASARPRLFQRFMIDAPFVGAPPDRTLSDRCDRHATPNLAAASSQPTSRLRACDGWRCGKSARSIRALLPGPVVVGLRAGHFLHPRR